MKQLSLFIWAALLCCCASAADFLLTENGVPKCEIVLPASATVAQKHAAKELSTFLGKISGGKAPAIVDKAGALYPITFELNKKADCADEGYIRAVTKRGIKITARHDMAILFGIYDLLKETTGIRWLYPGSDGEYYKVQPTIKVAGGKKTVNPSFPYRTLSFHSAAVQSRTTDTWDWMVRNNMRITVGPWMYKPKYGLADIIDDRAAVLHSQPDFDSMLGHGSYTKEMYASIDRMFEEHKDYFPLINGKRTKLARSAYQPCTTHPDVVKISVEGLWNVYMSPLKGTGTTFIYNNDGTGWCQCERCTALDSARDKKNGFVSNRFWHYMNALIDELYKTHKPTTPIYCIAYQNFQAPPEIPIDPRIKGAILSYNRVCYRHEINDPKCLTNPRFLEFYNGWATKGIDVIGREELAPQGNTYQPTEEIYIKLLKFYKKKGFEGNKIAIGPPDGWYRKEREAQGKIQWKSMWRHMYYNALYLWDIDADFAKIDEEINSLWYGKAWEAGMRDYLKLLRKSALEAPGCFGHGHSTPLGRNLDQPGVHEKLLKYLDAAEKAAATDPDPRALAHVKFDRQRFNQCWEKAREIYLKNYRELRSYPRTEAIKIDGVLDEYDWKNADVVTNFKSFSDATKIAKYQTYARIVYEPEYLYVAVEMMEPDTKNIKTEILKRDGAVWDDNGIELFISHPDMGNNYYQFIINAAGTVFDQRVTPGANANKAFNSSLEVKTRILSDRWVVEMKIPTAELGEKCFAGQNWKVNMMRSRKGKVYEEYETSTLSGGPPHDTGTFMGVAFSEKRSVTKGNNYEVDARLWRNGNFNEPGKFKKQYSRLNIKDGKVPSGWNLSGNDKSAFVWAPIAPGSSNYTISVTKGKITNQIKSKAKRFRLNYRYRGEGNAIFYVFRYNEKWHNLPSKLLFQLNGKHPEWANGKFEFDNPAQSDVENHVFAIIVNGSYEFDEIFLSPINE